MIEAVLRADSTKSEVSMIHDLTEPALDQIAKREVADEFSNICRKLRKADKSRSKHDTVRLLRFLREAEVRYPDSCVPVLNM